MKLALAILAMAGLLFATGCAGVYVHHHKATLAEDIASGGGWYWYDGENSLDECVDAWNANK